jgi:hypothetical protein
VGRRIQRTLLTPPRCGECRPTRLART